MSMDFVARGLAARSIPRSDLAGDGTNRGDALVGTRLAATGSVPRTLADKNAERVSPADFGAVADLSGDTGTDNTAAFQALCAYVNANGGHVYIDGAYRITDPLAIYAGTWEFSNRGLIRNTNDFGPSAFWRNTAVFIGSILGVNSPGGVNAIAPLAIEPMLAGATSFTLADSAAAAAFVPGDVVYITDANAYSGGSLTLFIASHVSEVLSVTGATVTLRDPSPLPITANGSTRPVVRRWSEGAIPPISPLGAGLPPTAKLARSVRIINAAFESAKMDNSQVVHVSAHDSDLDFRWIKGGILLGMNPVSYTRVNLRGGAFGNCAWELAYLHCHVTAEVVRARRVLGGTGYTVAPVAISEYGHTVKIGMIDISDFPFANSGTQPVVAINTPINDIGTILFNGTHAGGVGIGSSGQRGENTRIGLVLGRGVAPGNAGIYIDCDFVTIDDVSIKEVGSLGFGVFLKSAAGRNVVLRKVELGTGQGSGSQYRVIDQRPAAKRNVIGLTSGHYRMGSVKELGLSGITGAGTLQSLRSYSVAAGCTGKQTGWRIRAMGNVTAASTNAAKTIKLNVTAGGISVGDLTTVSLTSPQTGFVVIDATLQLAGTLNQLDTMCETVSPAGNVKIASTYNVAAAATGDMVFSLMANMGSLDTFNLREWSVVPLGDESETA